MENKPKVLILGGSGFIGSRLVTMLTQTCNIVAPSSKELSSTSYVDVSYFLNHNYYDAVINASGMRNLDVKSQTRSDIFDYYTDSFSLFYEQSDKFGKYINLGSGAEFGISNSIENVSETMFPDSPPLESYGHAKWQIHKDIETMPNFHNVRIFGCFGHTEPKERLFSKFLNHVQFDEEFTLIDRYFDMFSVIDLGIIIERILYGDISDKTINAVYKEKYKISELLHMFCEENGIDTALVRPIKLDNKNYTGNGDLLASYNLPLYGLRNSMALYNNE